MNWLQLLAVSSISNTSTKKVTIGDWRTCQAATRNGHLNCLIYAHKNGCKWDKHICNVAARWSYLDCLRYAHENGCEMDWSKCMKAATEGQLQCLIYEHENGYGWEHPAIAECSECIKYLYIL